MKSEEHLITFKSGANKRQINFFLMKKNEHLYCKNCKVNPRDILTQHRLLTLGIMIKRWKRQRMLSKGETRIRWWKLNGAPTKDFEKKLSEKGPWSVEVEPNKMWNRMAHCTKGVRKEVLEISRRCMSMDKDTWWWNDTVQTVIKVKKCSFKWWQQSGNIEDLGKYKKTRKEAKQAISDAKFNAYEGLYNNNLSSQEGEGGGGGRDL